MEKYILSDDITVICERASSFPNGVLYAHQKLHSHYPPSGERRFFGISRPNEKGEIIYMAAVEKMNGDEAEEFEIFIIKKGEYISELIIDFMRNVNQIGECFQRLLQQPNIDPNGYCLEIYLNEKDVRCMVGIKK